MTRPLPANRSPQTLALPGFVVSGIPKLQGLGSSDDSARSHEAQGSGHPALVFERVQMTPAEPGFDRASTRSSVRGPTHLNAFKWSVAWVVTRPTPRHPKISMAGYLNAFKRPPVRCENSPSSSPFERVQMTRLRGSPGVIYRPCRRPILLIPIPTGGPMPPPQ
jgi:hypothetical protein